MCYVFQKITTNTPWLSNPSGESIACLFKRKSQQRLWIFPANHKTFGWSCGFKKINKTHLMSIWTNDQCIMKMTQMQPAGDAMLCRAASGANGLKRVSSISLWSTILKSECQSQISLVCSNPSTSAFGHRTATHLYSMEKKKYRPLRKHSWIWITESVTHRCVLGVTCTLLYPEGEGH